MNKILVIGGLGFVGYHLVKKLAKNNNVTVLDNLSSGCKRNKINGVRYIYGESNSISNFMVGKGIDIVYHLGEYSRVLTSFDDIEKVISYNIIGTSKVIEYCRINNIKLVYAGSSTRFGDSKSPYSISKKNNAEMIKNYGKWFKLKYAIAYFYNVYGDRQISTGRYATLIGILKNNVRRGKPHKINKPGTQKRIFTHVDDVVDGLILIGEKGSGEYCLGSNEEYSIIKVAKMFGGKIEMVDSKKGDRNYSKIDLTRIKRLGWKATKQLKKYINV